MIYYLVIGIYLIGLLIIGFSKSGSIKNQEDFSVAGRSLSTWILVGTMAATWMGTGSVLGNAGKTFEIGAAGFLLPIGGMLGVLVLTLIPVPCLTTSVLYCRVCETSPFANV
jgi:Na+/proline symporter